MPAMAELVAAGEIEVPIAATYPLDDVREVFEQLEDRHARSARSSSFP